MVWPARRLKSETIHPARPVYTLRHQRNRRYTTESANTYLGDVVSRVSAATTTGRKSSKGQKAFAGLVYMIQGKMKWNRRATALVWVSLFDLLEAVTEDLICNGFVYV